MRVERVNITDVENQVQVETWLQQHTNVTYKYIPDFCIYMSHLQQRVI